MAKKPHVLLSGFGDEAAIDKTADQQLSAFAALGLHYYSLRFIDVGNGVKNVMKLTKTEIKRLQKLHAAYGMQVATIGSPIGKVKLQDVDDGTHNAFVPFKKYLANDVARACEMAHAFETKLVRGFSFYHPRGSDPWAHLDQAVDQLGQIAEKCADAGCVFGLEVEANLVGQDGKLLGEIHKQVSQDALVLVFDAGNLISLGMTTDDVFVEYEAMKKGIGWIHIKDYRNPRGATRQTHVDEEALKNFVPAHLGHGGHERILRDFRKTIPKLERRLAKLGVPGVFLDLEPHVKGGGQFGGFSGPDGLGVALRGLCSVLDYVGIDFSLRDFDDIVASRGF